MARQPTLRVKLLAAAALLAIAVLLASVSAASAGLPDKRAYELVSPPTKGGADIIAQSSKTFAATDGNGVAFPTTGTFGDVRGTSTDVQYLSRRDSLPGTNGWTTHAINPPGGAPTILALFNNNLPTFEAAFSPDLSAGIYRSWRSLTNAPNVAGVSNLYRLRNLDARNPQLELVSAASVPLGSAPGSQALLRQSTFAGASSDLSRVIFQSPWRLTGDGGFSFNGDLYEYADGVGVRRVGRVPPAPGFACDDSAGPLCEDAASSQAGVSVGFITGTSQYSAGMISADGSRILFQVPAGDLAGALYLREDGVRTLQVNGSEKTEPESPGPAQAWEMSRDGRRVFFTTSEGLVDGDEDGSSDLYMYDRSAAEGSRLTRISANSVGETCFVHGTVGVDSDGRYVYFLCDGQLVPGEPGSTVGLFLWHDGNLAYIGRFEDFNDARFNTPRTIWQFSTNTRTSRVTPDGRFLLFMAKRDEGFRGRGGFEGYDHGSTCDYGGGLGGCRELYLYSADTARLVCASCNRRASVATADALTDVYAGANASARTQHLSRALSDDGRRVFFSTREALVTEDSNSKMDAYEYDVASGTLHLISSGTDSADSYFLDASPDGHDVFFATRERLVGWDVDQNYDLYDARVDGGFPEPPPPGQPCAGDTCHLSAAAAPALRTGASANFRGAGDARPRLRKHRRCRRGAVLRSVRGKRKCVQRRVRSRARRHTARTRPRNERSGR